MRNETLTTNPSMQSVMSPRDRSTPLPPPLTFAPLGQAVMESFEEGIVVFDSYGRVLYANELARRTVGSGDLSAERAATLRPRLAALGGRVMPLKVGTSELGEAVFLPAKERPRTLAERERQAILDTLEGTSGKLAEAARRLGISRTTLWRRLKAYGLDRDGRNRWSRAS